MHLGFPRFLTNIYGSDSWVRILGLTATLNSNKLSDMRRFWFTFTVSIANMVLKICANLLLKKDMMKR